MQSRASEIAGFRKALTGAYRRFNALQREEKRRFGVTMSQCIVLELLHEEGRQSVQALASEIGLDTSTVTRIVDLLVRDGLLVRSRDEAEDRRRVFVSLTSRGDTLATELIRCTDGYCERLLQRLPKRQRPAVIGGLAALAEAFDTTEPPACEVRPTRKPAGTNSRQRKRGDKAANHRPRRQT